MNPKKRFKKNRIFLRIIAMALVFMLTGSLCAVAAQDTDKVVRVGWYDSAFNQMDDLGRRTGYAYEYEQKVALYTGWHYEYVEGSWPELLQMLKDGKIDLMSDVSYTVQREKDMFFSSLPMGSEEYYLFTTPDNKDISTSDYSSFNGKKVGANKGSIQIELFKDWAASNGIQAEIVELTGTESDCIARLVRGDFDLYLTLDSAADRDFTVPVCKIGSSDFFFAVNKNRPDLLSELNSAMNHIQDDNYFFNQQLYGKYLKQTKFNSYLSSEEAEWIAEHKTIKFGYQDNYLAFCAKDPKTGELIGALSDYLKTAENSIENASFEFEPVAFSTAQEALEALKKGEIDCMFPVNLTDYYGETKGYSITSPLMSTEMSAIVAQANAEDFFKKERVLVAVNAGNPNYEMFLLDHFPEWRSIYFKNTPDGLKAISQGKADCLLMSTFRYSDVSKLCDKYNLTQINAGVEMDYCIAVRRDNYMLYSILNKMISAVPDTTMSTALSRYSVEGANKSFSDYLKSQPGLVAASILITLLIIVFSLIRNLGALKRAKKNRELISATQTDELTGLYMKNFFYEYAHRMYQENPDKPMDAVIVNIIRFHSINAINGRSFGDNVLRAIGEEISAFIDENGGIAGHTEADYFAIYCPHLDDCHILFDRLQRKLDLISTNTNIRLRMGVMPWEEGCEPNELFEHALVASNLARGLYNEHLVVFDENMRKKEAFEQQLLHDIHRAVDEHELVVYYQPKFDIQKDPIELSGSEALVRWQHPQYGLIMPNDFVPLLERNGLISDVDSYVWREVVKQAAKWRESFSFFLPISINFSRLDIFDSKLEATLDELLSSNGLDKSAIQLEVTETAYTENSEGLIRIIEKLRAKGYIIEMDDFGTGYSSLSMLSAMPIDTLKLDKSFIDDIDINNKQIQLIELILDIAEDLKIPVVAEGVETSVQLKLLQELGCSFAQGFYFSKPLPADKFENEYVKNYKWLENSDEQH